MKLVSDFVAIASFPAYGGQVGFWGKPQASYLSQNTPGLYVGSVASLMVGAAIIAHYSPLSIFLFCFSVDSSSSSENRSFPGPLFLSGLLMANSRIHSSLDLRYVSDSLYYSSCGPLISPEASIVFQVFLYFWPTFHQPL